MRRDTQTARISADLGLDSRHDPWLAELADPGVEVPGATPPAPDAVAALLRRLGCCADSVHDAVGTFPTPQVDPARWWLLDRSFRRLASTTGDVDAAVGPWPELPEHLGTAAACFPLHLYALAVPTVRGWHDAHGVPAEVSWATLADLGRHDTARQRTKGKGGPVDLAWLQYHLRGLLLEVGGLQYRNYRLGNPDQPVPWLDDDAARAHGPGFLPGDLAVSLHLPEGAVLDPATVEQSMAAARSLMDRVAPTKRRRILTGSSWILDDELPKLLPPGSNLLRLRQSFELVPGWVDGDTAIVRSVFGQWGEAPDLRAARTRLQKAVLAHLDAGGHFRWRTGWRDWPAA